jgi:uncharacterized protein (DUF362 family)
MSKPNRWGGTHRRQFLCSLGKGAAGASFFSLAAKNVSAARIPEGDPARGIPGPFPGRVIEVAQPSMIRQGVKNADAVRAAMQRGMMELAGAETAAEVWASFFRSGDVVGIKVNPVGSPLAMTNTEVLLETIAGLRSAGVRAKDIVVFDRYKSELIRGGFDKNLPDGVRWHGLTPEADKTQLAIRGYDPDEYISMELVQPKQDPNDDRTRRSHLGLLLTKEVDKIVCLPVLKDHGSAGVTLALKNMSHGFVNNVARSHGGPHYNVCNQFIPEVVSHPIIRRKVVLQILDGIKGVFQGGPYAHKPDWTWERNSLFFATDPVAMDHVGWEIIDAERERRGFAPVGSAGRLGFDAKREHFDFRQPQHIPLAGALGLGVFDKEQIEHRRVQLS